VFPFPLGDGTALRLYEERDTDELYAVVDANRVYLSRWLPWPPGQTRADTLEFIRRSRRQLNDNQGFQVAIVECGAIVGGIGFHRIDWERRATTIGYWIAEGSQGRGTVTRAAACLIDHAFDVWELERIEIRAAPDNRRSRAIPERLGFHQERVIPNAERLADRIVDHVVYALHTDEYSAANPGAVPTRRPSPEGHRGQLHQRPGDRRA
jgi:ribosomal-protein-serine acetyltransferase